MTTPPTEPTAAERAAAQIAKRFGEGRTQPRVDGRPPRARAQQAAKQIAKRFPSRNKSWLPDDPRL